MIIEAVKSECESLQLLSEDDSEHRPREHLHRVEEPEAQPLDELVASSPAMRELCRQIDLVAGTDVTVLIEGATGTGKDLVARTLHRASPRAGRPLVTVNASNLQEQLFESEMFGHVRGAFSGAHAPHEGLVRSAEGGTLLIDEIAELPLTAQAKLLHFLDTRQVRPVGSTHAHRVDVRLLCATHRDLLQEVRCDRFREDLYYRLRVISLRLPSLRERRQDLPLLIEHFLRRFSTDYGRRIAGLSDEARSLLLSHPWPGNVRQLENEIERAVIMIPDGGKIEPSILSPEVRRPQVPELPQLEPSLGLREFRHTMERKLVLEVLEQNGWNVTASARELDISRVGLTKKMKRLGIERPERRRRRRTG